jgi:hypothetical protein
MDRIRKKHPPLIGLLKPIIDKLPALETVPHVEKTFLVFASTGLLPGGLFLNPVTLAMVMQMKCGLIIPG